MKGGGIEGWCLDLTLPDPYHVLPVVAAAVIFLYGQVRPQLSLQTVLDCNSSNDGGQVGHCKAVIYNFFFCIFGMGFLPTTCCISFNLQGLKTLGRLILHRHIIKLDARAILAVYLL
jgi:membrane protein insertase Oxa1/YidC/SpoIIIJ